MGLYEKSYPGVPGITNETIPVENNSFSKIINVSENADAGEYVIWISVPGRDGVYGSGYGVNASELIKHIIDDYCGGDAGNLRSKTQDQILAILNDATINKAGSDDLACLMELTVGYPTYNFYKKIKVDSEADTGNYTILVLSPGMDGVYADSYYSYIDSILDLDGAGPELGAIDVSNKTQEEIVSIIQDATINQAGSDDLLWMGYLSVYQSIPSVITIPLIHNGKLFVGCSDNKIYALNATNPNIVIWKSVQLEGNISKYLSVDKEGVYATTDVSPHIPTEGFVYKLSLENGTVIWKYRNGNPIIGGVNNNLVFVGYRGGWEDDGYAIALNKTTGTKVWGPIDISDFHTTLCAIDGNRVYISGYAATGVKFRAIYYDGMSAWTDYLGSAYTGRYTIVDNEVFTLYSSPHTSQNFYIMVYNSTTGSKIATYPIGIEQDHYGADFAVAPNEIIITNSSGVFAYNRSDFSLLWSCSLSAEPYREQPIVTRDTVIVASKDNRINFIDSISGQIYRIEEIGVNITSPMSLRVDSSGCIYIGTEYGIRSIPFSTTGEHVNWVSYGRDFRHTGFVDCLRVKKVSAFDTGSGTYPSISGTHNGTIKLNQAITVHKLYTYPCEGTGGHTEQVKIWDENGNIIINATWAGYSGDWHNITFPETTLEAGKTYNYTIRTRSYPQIHHTSALQTANGWINCTEFVDANGRKYYDWIPAIMLEWSPSLF